MRMNVLPSFQRPLNVRSSHLLFRFCHTSFLFRCMFNCSKVLIINYQFQEQNNATITSTPGPFVNCPPHEQRESSPVIVDLEKEPMELADNIDDDLEDRPLVVDLGDSHNTPSPIGSSPASRKFFIHKLFRQIHFVS